jgi:3-hydroxyisobutyrate dehydrogenase
LAASEAIRLGQRFGFESATVLDISQQLGDGDVDAVLRQEVITRRFETGVQLGLVRRNLDLAERLAAATDTRSPLIEATLAAWNAAERRLGYGADHSSVIKWLETLPSLKPAAEPESKPEIIATAPSV